MKSRRPNQPRVIRSVVAKKKKKKKLSRHLASRKSRKPEAAAQRPNIDFASSLVASRGLSSAGNAADGNRRRTGTHANMHGMHACMGCMRRGTMHAASRQKGFPMQIAKAARPAKITVGNNAVDWEVELARASRETDNISLGRPLRRTIK